MSLPVIIDYTNWRGERRKRSIQPISIRYDSTEWHPEKQWLLTAMDENMVTKEFAMKDIHAWEPKS